jgi:two-component system sensor histidine kinase AgrC
MTKSKEAISYIDKILKNEKDDYNIELLKKLHYLPQGGLKGLIYYKIEQMIDKKIDVYVDISSNLKNTKVLKDNLQDISKIIGVYLDNAIEAALNADKKYIIIESYMEDDNIVFKFSNTYKESVDLNKVDKEGYTTKGEGKGYGLSLVKDILENNKTFSQERELNGIYYVQKLYIKNKA